MSAEALFALAVFLGLPLAALFVVARFRPGRRVRRGGNGGDGRLEPRVANVEQVAVFHEDQLADLQQRVAALEQAQVPLYRVQ